jgi:hypothetical protein
MKPDPQPVYQLTLTPASGNWQAPPLLRFRALLKTALRGYGLRAVSVREIPPPATEHQEPPPSDL